MKFTALIITLLSTSVFACTSELWGQGTCDYPLQTAGGNGPPLTKAIVNQLGTCFKNKYGPGPWKIDGVALPDASGQGNAWGVYTTIGGNPFMMSVGNLCTCTQSMDANVVVDLAAEAASGGHLSILENCGMNSESCPAAGNSQGFVPSGMYASVYSCPDNPCDGGDYQRWE